MDNIPNREKEMDKYLRKVSAYNLLESSIGKEDDMECCICLEHNIGIKLPKCWHFLCPECYIITYRGFISDEFYKNNQPPKKPTISKPIYPYDIDEHTDMDKILKQEYNKLKKLDNTLENDYATSEWFIYYNEDLYNSIKNNDYNANPYIKKWFIDNEQIEKYENDLLEYNNIHEEYEDELDDYRMSYQMERIDNIKGKCPLCNI